MAAKHKVSDDLAVSILKRKFGKAKEFTIEDVRAVYHTGIGSLYARRLIGQKRMRHVGRNRYKLS